jgi:hypothetical protein
MGFVVIFNRGLGWICGWWMVLWFERVGKLFLAECLFVPYSGYRCRVYEPFNIQLSCINQNTYRVKKWNNIFRIFCVMPGLHVYSFPVWWQKCPQYEHRYKWIGISFTLFNIVIIMERKMSEDYRCVNKGFGWKRRYPNQDIVRTLSLRDWAK